MAGAAEQDLHCLARVAGDLLDSGEVDALLMSGYFGGYGEYGPEIAAAELAVAGQLGEVMARTGRPVAVHTMFPGGPAADALRARGIPVFRRAESASVGLGLLAPRGRRGDRRGRCAGAPRGAAPASVADWRLLAGPAAAGRGRDPVSGGGTGRQPRRAGRRGQRGCGRRGC